ncbi:hypothetical protein F5Y03DRAFT_367215 [Xylaria venustula]|nr:hypothetical protein F5Y03DRAFT_367215 [Xylaria venustula]
MLIYSIGTTLGPFIGGAIVEAGDWRWVFYINLPIGGVCLLVLYRFLHVNQPQAAWSSRLRHLDFVGISGRLSDGAVPKQLNLR